MREPMRRSVVQGIVDAAAVRLSRPVVMVDRLLNLIAFSEQDDDVDEVRSQTILCRRSPPPAAEYVRKLGVGSVMECPWLRVPANEALHMASRVCVPIQYRDLVLGYFWMVDEPDRLTDAELEIAVHAAEAAALELYRERLETSCGRAREAELVEMLLGSAQTPEALQAASDLIDARILAVSRGVTVLVLMAVREDGRAAAEEERMVLVSAVEQVRRSFPPGSLVASSCGSHVRLVLASGDYGEASRCASKLLGAAAGAMAGHTGLTVAVGCGSGRWPLASAAESLGEAWRATAVAMTRPPGQRVAMFHDLGADALLLGLLDGESPGSLVPPSIVALAATEPELLATLHAYLDYAGDAQATSTALHMHRSTLYKRLHRVEELTGLSVHAGDERLLLHLALRLHRLAAGNAETALAARAHRPSPPATAPPSDAAELAELAELAAALTAAG
jgi:sugar diacid utilization regulator